jgi:DNA-binding NarL/FixJ family response regulator
MSLIRIAVLSDDRLFSDGVSGLLTADSTFDVVRSAQGADLPALRVLNLRIVVIDSRMDGALDLCHDLGSEGVAAVFVCTPSDDSWSLDALCAGARGILEKSARPEDLIKALRFVAEGQIWSSRPVMTAWLAQLTAAVKLATNVEKAFEDRLSQREMEVFRHAATGMGNKELADRLAISEATIKVHLTHIFQKLGVRGRAELAAAYHGILPRTSGRVSARSDRLRRPA